MDRLFLNHTILTTIRAQKQSGEQNRKEGGREKESSASLL